MKYAVFLRGMNLGKRRVTNEDLVGAMAELGFPGVQAYQASGNLVLDTPLGQVALKTMLEKGLQDAFGYEVPTFLRTTSELRTILSSAPSATITKPNVGDRAKLQVVFLTRALDKTQAEWVTGLSTQDDWLGPTGHEIFWWPRHGVGHSELDFKSLERQLGTTTVRTLGTVERLVSKFFGSVGTKN